MGLSVRLSGTYTHNALEPFLAHYIPELETGVEVGGRVQDGVVVA